MAASQGTAARVVEIAMGEVGYLEKATTSNLDNKTSNAGYNNYTKYNRDCGFGNGPAWFWCNSFVSWCAMKAGVSANIVPKTASCAVTRNFFSSRNRLHLRASGYKPVAGDLVLFTTSGYPSGTGHIGIVRYSDQSNVYTVEGNTSGGSAVIDNGGGVCTKSYPLSKSSIYGYCHPAYVQVQGDDEVVKSAKLRVGDVTFSASVIEKNDVNFVKIRDFEKAGCIVNYDDQNDIPIVLPAQTRYIPDKPKNAEVAAALKKLQEKTGFADGTMDYLYRYTYGDDLIVKLANAMK